MKLTDKCEADFHQYCQNKGLENFNNKKYALLVIKEFWNALIIDFLDTSDLLKGFNSFENIFYREYRNTCFKDRKRATKQAIIKANEIYNAV